MDGVIAVSLCRAGEALNSPSLQRDSNSLVSSISCLSCFVALLPFLLLSSPLLSRDLLSSFLLLHAEGLAWDLAMP